MKQQPQFPELLFSADGAVLWRSTATDVVAWDFGTKHVRYKCAGRMVGVSTSGAIFITEKAPNDFGVWDCATGAARTLTPELIADLPLHVRYRVYLQAADTPRYQWHLVDVAGQQSPQTFTAQAASDLMIENWALVPHHLWLAYTTFYDDGMFDSASGGYQALGAESAPAISLKPSRFHRVPPLYFSAEHDWVVTGQQNAFNIYTASTGKEYGYMGFYILSGGGDVVAFHPRERYHLAVNLDPYLTKDNDKQGFLLLDVSDPKKDQGVRLQTFNETEPVTALAFHPHGHPIAALLPTTIHVWGVNGTLLFELKE